MDTTLIEFINSDAYLVAVFLVALAAGAVLQLLLRRLSAERRAERTILGIDPGAAPGQSVVVTYTGAGKHITPVTISHGPNGIAMTTFDRPLTLTGRGIDIPRWMRGAAGPRISNDGLSMTDNPTLTAMKVARRLKEHSLAMQPYLYWAQTPTLRWIHGAFPPVSAVPNFAAMQPSRVPAWMQIGTAAASTVAQINAAQQKHIVAQLMGAGLTARQMAILSGYNPSYFSLSTAVPCVSQAVLEAVAQVTIADGPLVQRLSYLLLQELGRNRGSLYSRCLSDGPDTFVPAVVAAARTAVKAMTPAMERNFQEMPEQQQEAFAYEVLGRIFAQALEKIRRDKAIAQIAKAPHATVFGEVTGWRAWDISKSAPHRLMSVGVPCRWPSGTMGPDTSEFIKENFRQTLPETSPSKCAEMPNVGYWAVRERFIEEVSNRYDSEIVGTVSMWGNVCEHELGWRAEYMRILHIEPGKAFAAFCEETGLNQDALITELRDHYIHSQEGNQKWISENPSSD